jgi:hypothetical protein
MRTNSASFEAAVKAAARRRGWEGYVRVERID